MGVCIFLLLLLCLSLFVYRVYIYIRRIVGLVECRLLGSGAARYMSIVNHLRLGRAQGLPGHG